MPMSVSVRTASTAATSSSAVDDLALDQQLDEAADDRLVLVGAVGFLGQHGMREHAAGLDLAFELPQRVGLHGPTLPAEARLRV